MIVKMGIVAGVQLETRGSAFSGHGGATPCLGAARLEFEPPELVRMRLFSAGLTTRSDFPFERAVMI